MSTLKQMQVLLPIVLGAVLLASNGASLEPGKDLEDPKRILRGPIPDKLIVLTFDDAPASHATVVAPILKKHGFGGSFYVCDFDSFRTRKDWYLTYRQMRAMADEGFEIGNHSLGHWGGLGHFMDMEDHLIANNVPKPTTVCWPVYSVTREICKDLSARDYTFGRGGHERPYRPTVDDPFDVPSFSITDGVTVEAFVQRAQQACEGRVVVFCFHGVPDMEHPSVGLDPETFKTMMQYLKDNEYTCIALRDMAKYIHPQRAAQLPPTDRNAKNAAPASRVKDARPYIGKEIHQFSLPGASGRIVGHHINVVVPPTAKHTALAPTIKTSEGAKVAPPSGVAQDFTNPQKYVVTAKDGTTREYLITVTRNVQNSSPATDIASFTLPGSTGTIISGSRIGVYVPETKDLMAIKPTISLSPNAKSTPAADQELDFTKPQKYTVTAEDGSTKEYSVTVVKAEKPASHTWTKPVEGNWSDKTRWIDQTGMASGPKAKGGPDLILNFNTTGEFATKNDFADGLRLNQWNLGPTMGLKVGGNPLVFERNHLTGNSPGINVNTRSERDKINVPIELKDDLFVKMIPVGRLTLEGPISGSGGLVLDNPGTNGEQYSNWGILRIDNKNNTYSGGTTINGGQLFLFVAPKGLGTGPVTLNRDGAIRLDGIHGLTNPLILNGGTIDGGGDLDGPITLNANTKISGAFNLNLNGGAMTGPGGFTQIGPIGAFGRVNGGHVYLWGANTYTGPTTVHLGTLHVKKRSALYNADAKKWVAESISIHPAATLELSAGGPGELTGEDLGTLLANLTSNVNNNGLSARSSFCIDTTNATEAIEIVADVTDANGPGGGAFNLKKIGKGTLKLSGKNTYTGRTILDEGTLSVSTLNSVRGGKPTSSLGAPKDHENGEIVFGADGKDGACTMTYTGDGETTDRAFNLAGKKSTLTIDHCGKGELKLSSPFLITGYGANKSIVLQGNTTGRGEIAGGLHDPYDRSLKATTAITKSGSGHWTLSGTNTYSGPTTISNGVLTLTRNASMSGKSDVIIETGAKLALEFVGEVPVKSITVAGKKLPAGKYDAKSLPGVILGGGTLVTGQ